MKCRMCDEKPISRGIKSITCFGCKQTKIISCDNSICKDCSYTYARCEMCGERIKPEKE